jgi:hypothetical protein
MCAPVARSCAWWPSGTIRQQWIVDRDRTLAGDRHLRPLALLLLTAGEPWHAACPLEATGRRCARHPRADVAGQPGRRVGADRLASPGRQHRGCGPRVGGRQPSSVPRERTSYGQRNYRAEVHEGPQEGRGQVLTPLRALVPAHPARHPRRPRPAQVRLPGRLPHQGRGTSSTRPGARAPTRTATVQTTQAIRALALVGQRRRSTSCWATGSPTCTPTRHSGCAPSAATANYSSTTSTPPSAPCRSARSGPSTPNSCTTS